MEQLDLIGLEGFFKVSDDLCPYCLQPLDRGILFVHDDNDDKDWHYLCAIKERQEFELTQ